MISISLEPAKSCSIPVSANEAGLGDDSHQEQSYTKGPCVFLIQVDREIGGLARKEAREHVTSNDDGVGTDFLRGSFHRPIFLMDKPSNYQDVSSPGNRKVVETDLRHNPLR